MNGSSCQAKSLLIRRQDATLTRKMPREGGEKRRKVGEASGTEAEMKMAVRRPAKRAAIAPRIQRPLLARASAHGRGCSRGAACAAEAAGCFWRPCCANGRFEKAVLRGRPGVRAAKYATSSQRPAETHCSPHSGEARPQNMHRARVQTQAKCSNSEKERRETRAFFRLREASLAARAFS